ncbi:MAG: hypothetical protein U0169_18910 [Polyangiaceae bacterium]
MRRVRSIAFALGLASSMLVPAVARADEQSELEKGRVAYYAKQYDEADERFRKMLDPKTGTVHDAVLVSQARMVWGAVLFAKKKREDANALFEQILLSDPQFEPDPLGYPTEVLNAFIDTRARIRDKLNAAAMASARSEAERRAREDSERKRQVARIAMLEKLAAEESVTVKNSRWIAAVPFGVGQFQNGQKALGYVFLSSELALATLSVAVAPFYVSNLDDADTAMANRDRFRAEQFLARANDLRVVNLVAVSALAATAVVGVLQAEISFVPESKTVKKRPIPEVGSVTPFAAPTVAQDRPGFVFGAVGRF